MQPVATPGGRNPSGRRSSSGAADARLGGWDPGPAATTDARLAGYYRHGPKNVASWSSVCSMRKGNITPFDYPVIAAGNRRAPRRIPDLLRWSMPTPLQLGPAHGEIGGVVMAQGPVSGRSLHGRRQSVGLGRRGSASRDRGQRGVLVEDPDQRADLVLVETNGSQSVDLDWQSRGVQARRTVAGRAASGQ